MLNKVYLKLSTGNEVVDVGCKVEDGVLVDVVNSSDISVWDRLSLQNRAQLARLSARQLNKPVTVNVQ